MRKFLFPAIAAAALALSACTEHDESYQIGASDAWSKVTGAGYSAASFGVPTGLLGANVTASFESAADRTGYWKFTREGRELGRLNVAVDGDDASSTVSYSYAKGDVSAEDEKAEKLVRQFSQLLVIEAIDSTIEGRTRNQDMKNQADAHSAMAMAGSMMKDASAAMDKAAREQELRQATSDSVGSSHVAAGSTKPTTDLSQYR